MLLLRASQVKHNIFIMINIKIKELRQEKELTQSELAKEIGVNRRTITGYEAGRRQPDIDTIKKLCKFFNVTSDYLLGIEEF